MNNPPSSPRKPPQSVAALVMPGDILRLRRWQSADEWCICTVDRASPNGEALLLIVLEGVLRPTLGGIMAGMIAVSVDPEEGIATELFTDTELEIEMRETQ
jgi:hypothetical protein